MSSLLDGPARILRESLSGLARRQQLIANNLANVDTPGYRSYDIPFEQVLARQTSTREQFDLLVTSPAHMSAADAFLEQALGMEVRPQFRSDGNGVDVDAEMSSLSETALEYNILAQMMTTRLGLLRSAVTEGRR